MSENQASSEFNVFVSWSKPTSRSLASAISEWLPNVVPLARPFFSDDDIQSGSVWFSEILDKLKSVRAGVLCVTRESSIGPWFNFEAGAMAGLGLKVCPVLFGVSERQLGTQLSGFQSTPFEHGKMLKLALDLNDYLGPQKALESAVENSFKACWPNLEKAFQEIMAVAPEQHSPERGIEDQIGELLDGVRVLVRRQKRDDEEKQMLREMDARILAAGSAFKTDWEEKIQRLVNRGGAANRAIEQVKRQNETLVKKLEELTQHGGTSKQPDQEPRT